MITIHCPHCSAGYSVDERAVGKSVGCKQCQQKFVVTADQPDPDAEFQLAPEPERQVAAAPKPAVRPPVSPVAPAGVASMSPNVGDLLDDVITTRKQDPEDEGHAPAPKAKKKKKKKVAASSSSSSYSDSGDGFGSRFMAGMGGVGGLLLTVALVAGRVYLKHRDDNQPQSSGSMVSGPQRPGTGPSIPRGSGSTASGAPQLQLSSATLLGPTCSVSYTNQGGDVSPGQRLLLVIRHNQDVVGEAALTGQIGSHGTVNVTLVGLSPINRPQFHVNVELEDRGARRSVSNTVSTQ